MKPKIILTFLIFSFLITYSFAEVRYVSKTGTRIPSYIPDSTKERPIQFRRGIGLQDGYQSYYEKYSDKNLVEEKKSLFPLKDAAGVWTEINPRVPQVDYLGIHFVNKDTGWAVGSLGAAIYSTNGGEKWQTASSPVANVLLSVHSHNGEVVVASGYDGIIIRSLDGGKNWQQISSGVNGDLWEIKMINDTLGWACGTGPSLLRTINAGETWEIINTDYNDFHYWALDFLDKNILYISGNGGNILKTTDGGNNWQLIQTGFGKNLYRIKLLNQERIVTGGEMGWIAYTSNGGSVWDTSTAGGLIEAMAFLNDSVGYVTGNLSPNLIYKTTNGGESWTPKYAVEIGNYCLNFVNDTLGFSSGLNLSVQKTTDGGVNWEKSILNDNFYDINFLNEYTGFVISGSLYKTTNGGESWEKIQGAPGGYSIKFIDDLIGFIGNNDGSIQKTIDGGENWYGTNSLSTAGQISKFLFWNENIGWALGAKLLKTTDRGENWIEKGNGGTSLFFIDSLVGWITRLNGRPYKTTDGGETWIEQTNLTLFQTRDIYFPDYSNGFILESNKLYKTINEGVTFNLIPDITGFSIAAKFKNYGSNIIFIIGYKTYRSIDAGGSWLDFIDLTGMRINGFSLLGAGLGYSVGELGLCLKYFDEDLTTQIINFAIVIEDLSVKLFWSTTSEIYNYGFEIERSDSLKNWGKIGFISGENKPSDYLFIDTTIYNNGMYYYRLKQIDEIGKYNYYPDTAGIDIYIDFVTSVGGENPALKDFRLYQNYPNPFNPVTRIQYSVGSKQYAVPTSPLFKRGDRGEFVSLKVYDVLGNEIATLVNEEKSPGNYEVRWNAEKFSSGIYFYVLSSREKTLSKKMLLVK